MRCGTARERIKASATGELIEPVFDSYVVFGWADCVHVEVQMVEPVHKGLLSDLRVDETKVVLDCDIARLVQVHLDLGASLSSVGYCFAIHVGARTFLSGGSSAMI